MGITIKKGVVTLTCNTCKKKWNVPAGYLSKEERQNPNARKKKIQCEQCAEKEYLYNL